MSSEWPILSPFPPEGGLHARWARGRFVRPLSYPFGPNPWKVWAWAVLRLAYVYLPFVSYSGRWAHGYIGGKQFRTGPYPDPGHLAWMRPGEADTTFVTWSARFGLGARS